MTVGLVFQCDKLCLTNLKRSLSSYFKIAQFRGSVSLNCKSLERNILRFPNVLYEADCLGVGTMKRIASCATQ